MDLQSHSKQELLYRCLLFPLENEDPPTLCDFLEVVVSLLIPPPSVGNFPQNISQEELRDFPSLLSSFSFFFFSLFLPLLLSVSFTYLTDSFFLLSLSPISPCSLAFPCSHIGHHFTNSSASTLFQSCASEFPLPGCCH